MSASSPIEAGPTATWRRTHPNWNRACRRSRAWYRGDCGRGSTSEKQLPNEGSLGRGIPHGWTVANNAGVSGGRPFHRGHQPVESRQTGA